VCRREIHVHTSAEGPDHISLWPIASHALPGWSYHHLSQFGEERGIYSSRLYPKMPIRTRCVAAMLTIVCQFSMRQASEAYRFSYSRAGKEGSKPPKCVFPSK
jgi:hypothetical protein